MKIDSGIIKMLIVVFAVTIIAALIINRSAIEQSEDYRVRLTVVQRSPFPSGEGS